MEWSNFPFPFKSELSLVHNDKRYQVFAHVEKKPFLLLQSSSGTPIAAIFFVPLNGGAIVTKRSEHAALSVFEHDEQDFSIHVVNLSENDRLCFDIRKGPSKSDPRVNTITLLRPLEMVRVQSDDSAGNKAMKLCSLGTDVQSDEQSQGGPKGTYYYVSVYPTNANDDWKDAYWTCCYYFCREKKQSAPLEWCGTQSWGALPAFESGQTFVRRGFSFGGHGEPLVGRNNATFFGEHFVGEWSTRPANASRYNFSGAGGGAEEFSVGGENFSAQAFTGGGFGGGAALSFAGGGASFADSDAFAASVRHGESRQVNSHTVECNVHYNNGTQNPLLVCMSVAKQNVLLRQGEPDWLEMAFACAYDQIKSENKRIMRMIKHTFAEQECVCCMSNAPAFIYAICGHKCFCAQCDGQIKKCPICRGEIVARIK